MKNVKVSIIIPIFNAGKYLNECIKSVLNQSYRDMELILVDDGSEDDSLEICNKYKNLSDISVKIIHQNNSGSSIARKIGVSFANGEYIGFVDADDYIDNRMYEKMIAKAEEFNADIIICGISYLKRGKLDIQSSQIKAGVYTGQKLDYLKNRVCMDGTQNADEIISPSLGNKLIKKEIILKHMKDITTRLSMGDDWVVSYPCLWDANTVVMMDDCFYVYRYNSEGITKSYNLNMWNDLNKLFDLSIKINLKYLYRKEDYYRSYFQYMILLCLENETKYDKRLNIFELCRKIKKELKEPMCIYAFEGKISEFPSKKNKIMFFLAKYKIYSLISILLIIKKINRNVKKDGKQFKND